MGALAAFPVGGGSGVYCSQGKSALGEARRAKTSPSRRPAKRLRVVDGLRAGLGAGPDKRTGKNPAGAPTPSQTSQSWGK